MSQYSKHFADLAASSRRDNSWHRYGTKKLRHSCICSTAKWWCNSAICDSRVALHSVGDYSHVVYRTSLSVAFQAGHNFYPRQITIPTLRLCLAPAGPYLPISSSHCHW